MVIARILLVLACIVGAGSVLAMIAGAIGLLRRAGSSRKEHPPARTRPVLAAGLAGHGKVAERILGAALAELLACGSVRPGTPDGRWARCEVRTPPPAGVDPHAAKLWDRLDASARTQGTREISLREIRPKIMRWHTYVLGELLDTGWVRRRRGFVAWGPSLALLAPVLWTLVLVVGSAAEDELAGALGFLGLMGSLILLMPVLIACAPLGLTPEGKAALAQLRVDVSAAGEHDAARGVLAIALGADADAASAWGSASELVGVDAAAAVAWLERAEATAGINSPPPGESEQFQS